MVFSSIIGQVKAKKLLTRAMAADRLAHGYLFTGPDGVGKTSFGLALAAGLLCEQKSAEKPCGHCAGCLQFASGNHPDFLRICPDGAAIKIDQIRGLKKAVSFSPFGSGVRVVLIEDVQTMRREAGNSLLKILEEPPPDNVLLLIASESEPVLPTILSRCQIIPFSPLSDDQAVQVVEKLHPDLNREDARSLALLAGGCPGQVAALRDEAMLQLRTDCIQAITAVPEEPARQIELALDLAGRMAELQENLDMLFDLLAIFFKDQIVAQLSPVQGAEVSPGAAQRERWNLQHLSDKILAVDAARNELARNCNRGLVCEVLLLELVA